MYLLFSENEQNELMFKHSKAQITRYAVFRHFAIWIFFFVFYFLLHPIDNTLVVQYQLVEGCLNYVYIIKKKKIRMEKGTLE